MFKKTSLLLVLCIALLELHAQQVRRSLWSPALYQDSVMERYNRAIRAYDANYHCTLSESQKDSIEQKPNVSGDRAFDTLFKPILSNVFIGSNDLVQDGPASSFTQDPDKGTLSANFSMFLDDTRNKFLNLGVFSKANDGIFGIYTTGSWSSEIGFNVSYSSVISKSRYFNEKECDSLVQSGARKRYYLELLSKVSGLAGDRAIVAARMNIVIDSLNNLWDTAKISTQWAADYTRLTAEYKRLDSQAKAIDASTPDSVHFASSGFYKAAVDSAVSLFEIKNDIFSGYYLHWWTLRGSLSNNAITAGTDSLDAAVKASYQPKNIIKMNIGCNMSWISENRDRLWFLRGGVDFGLHNFADHPTVKKPYLRYDGEKTDYNVYNKNTDLLGAYSDLRPNILTLEPTLNYSTFWGFFSKMFGIDARADARLPLSKPSTITKEIYPATFSLAAGPIFRLKKDGDISKGTIGVEAGLIDAPVNDNVWRFFSAKLKVGVSFSAFIK